jgi:hypothetical protein
MSNANWTKLAGVMIAGTATNFSGILSHRMPTGRHSAKPLIAAALLKEKG